jgi:ABC-2 type transport system permease protein
MLGGCMLPVEALPPFMQKAAMVSPVYWAVNGLERITLERPDPFALLPHVLVLSTVTLALLAFSFVVIKRKLVA